MSSGRTLGLWRRDERRGEAAESEKYSARTDTRQCSASGFSPSRIQFPCKRPVLTLHVVKQTNPVTPQQIVAFLLLRRCEWIGTIDYWRLQIKNRLPSHATSPHASFPSEVPIVGKCWSLDAYGTLPDLPYVHATTKYSFHLEDAAKDRAIQDRTGPFHTSIIIILNQGILLIQLLFLGGARADCRQAKDSNLGIVAFHPEAPRSTFNFAPVRISLLECHTE